MAPRKTAAQVAAAKAAKEQAALEKDEGIFAALVASRAPGRITKAFDEVVITDGEVKPLIIKDEPVEYTLPTLKIGDVTAYGDEIALNQNTFQDDYDYMDGSKIGQPLNDLRQGPGRQLNEVMWRQEQMLRSIALNHDRIPEPYQIRTQAVDARYNAAGQPNARFKFGSQAYTLLSTPQTRYYDTWQSLKSSDPDKVLPFWTEWNFDHGKLDGARKLQDHWRKDAKAEAKKTGGTPAYPEVFSRDQEDVIKDDTGDSDNRKMMVRYARGEMRVRALLGIMPEEDRQILMDHWPEWFDLPKEDPKLSLNTLKAYGGLVGRPPIPPPRAIYNPTGEGFPTPWMKEGKSKPDPTSITKFARISKRKISAGESNTLITEITDDAFNTSKSTLLKFEDTGPVSMEDAETMRAAGQAPCKAIYRRFVFKDSEGDSLRSAYALSFLTYWMTEGVAVFDVLPSGWFQHIFTTMLAILKDDERASDRLKQLHHLTKTKPSLPQAPFSGIPSKVKESFYATLFQLTQVACTNDLWQNEGGEILKDYEQMYMAAVLQLGVFPWQYRLLLIDLLLTLAPNGPGLRFAEINDSYYKEKLTSTQQKAKPKPAKAEVSDNGEGSSVKPAKKGKGKATPKPKPRLSKAVQKAMRELDDENETKAEDLDGFDAAPRKAEAKRRKTADPTSMIGGPIENAVDDIVSDLEMAEVTSKDPLPEQQDPVSMGASFGDLLAPSTKTAAGNGRKRRATKSKPKDNAQEKPLETKQLTTLEMNERMRLVEDLLDQQFIHAVTYLFRPKEERDQQLARLLELGGESFKPTVDRVLSIKWRRQPPPIEWSDEDYEEHAAIWETLQMLDGELRDTSKLMGRVYAFITAKIDPVKKMKVLEKFTYEALRIDGSILRLQLPMGDEQLEWWLKEFQTFLGEKSDRLHITWKTLKQRNQSPEQQSPEQRTQSPEQRTQSPQAALLEDGHPTSMEADPSGSVSGNEPLWIGHSMNDLAPANPEWPEDRLACWNFLYKLYSRGLTREVEVMAEEVLQHFGSFYGVATLPAVLDPKSDWPGLNDHTDADNSKSDTEAPVVALTAEALAKVKDRDIYDFDPDHDTALPASTKGAMSFMEGWAAVNIAGTNSTWLDEASNAAHEKKLNDIIFLLKKSSSTDTAKRQLAGISTQLVYMVTGYHVSVEMMLHWDKFFDKDFKPTDELLRHNGVRERPARSRKTKAASMKAGFKDHQKETGSRTGILQRSPNTEGQVLSNKPEYAPTIGNRIEMSEWLEQNDN